MLKFLTPAPLAFEAGALVAPAYGARYYPFGEAQAARVFLAGGGLPAAWAGQPDFVVLETGFGGGLNFLSTWAAWRADPARGARLHFLSIEKLPLPQWIWRSCTAAGLRWLRFRLSCARTGRR